MRKTVDYTHQQIKLRMQANVMTQRQLEHEFIVTHVPRFHRFLMEVFPWTRSLFNYTIARNEEDITRLTLIRGIGPTAKILARNFDPQDVVIAH